ncbi:MAG: hypothetical protein Q8P41_03445 [Pseudomonadota bacterium]|nr:hypothetical protein [Pseudomonadota bacterium]
MRVLLLALPLAGCTWIDEATLDERLGQDDTAASVCRSPLAEALPEETAALMATADSSLVEATSQDLGIASPIGCTDVVTGALVFGPASGWNGDNDSDGYAFAVPAPTRLHLTATWPDSSADLDFGVWSLDDDGTARVDLFSTNGESNCIGATDPEDCTSAIPLGPSEAEDRPYLLVALGYVGEGEMPYEVALEWVAP